MVSLHRLQLSAPTSLSQPKWARSQRKQVSTDGACTAEMHAVLASRCSTEQHTTSSNPKRDTCRPCRWPSHHRMAAAIPCRAAPTEQTWQHLSPRRRRHARVSQRIHDYLPPADLQAKSSPSPHYCKPLHFAPFITRVTSALFRQPTAGVVPVASFCFAISPLLFPLATCTCSATFLPSFCPAAQHFAPSTSVTSATVLRRSTEHQSYLSDLLLTIGQSTQSLFLQPGSRTSASRMTYRTSEEHLVPRYYFHHVCIYTFCF